MTRIKRGFTLLEVMAAIVILSIGASAAFKLIGSSTRAIRKAEAVTVQANLARKVMADIETLYWQKKADEIVTDGDFGSDFPDYTFHVEIVEEVQDEVDGSLQDVTNPDLREVTVTVFWNAVDPPTEFTLTTFFVDFGNKNL
ncbi:prepilin-type N-terminal cleavage/methylation domain-containing protein [bacterium]|jgi:prepilin-type N-terminal cleavage/methylation domain|nr:prepilin-type N-terminal cleavage/methylation domain-containing protein [bacterium]